MKLCKDINKVRFYCEHEAIAPFIYEQGQEHEKLTDEYLTALTKAPFFCFEVNGGLIVINPYLDGYEGHMLMLERGLNAVREAKKVLKFVKENQLASKFYGRCNSKQMAVFLNILKFKKIENNLYLRYL